MGLEAVNVEQLSSRKKGVYWQYFANMTTFCPANTKAVDVSNADALRLGLPGENCKQYMTNIMTCPPQEDIMVQLDMDRQHKAGIIRPSTSEWAANLVLVPKSNGTARVWQGHGEFNTNLKAGE